MTAENSEESKKKFLDCISKFNKVKDFTIANTNSGKEKKNEVLNYLILKLQFSKQCFIGS